MKKNMLFTMVTIGLILMIVLLTSKTVESQSYEDIKETEAYFQALEKAYISEVREYLAREGFINSGVMLTRTVNEEGKREYMMTIHHRKLQNISEDEIQQLVFWLADKAFWENNCSFKYCLKGNA